jgi:putative ABC transport system permease protein
MSQLRFAFRSLLKTPIVTAVAVLSVALGIGANVAIFSVFNQILLRPLPVPEPQRLVNLVAPGPRSGSVSCGQIGTCDSLFSYPMFRDLQRVQTSFTDIAAHRDFGANVVFGGASEGGDAALVSGSYFAVLELAPQLGRLIIPADETGAERVAVLSDEYWRRRFSAAHDIVGKALVVNGQPLTIVGVAPQGFHGITLGVRPRVYVPISTREIVVPRWKGLEDRRSFWAYLFARLKPGVSVDQARTIFNSQYRPIHTTLDVPLVQGMNPSMFELYKNMQMQLEPGARGQSRTPKETRQPLTLLFGVTLIVLLICCANVANLLLARAAARSTEMAVRLSIGAGRKHIVSQLLIESMLLASAGGAAGLVIARWTLAGMAAILPSGTVDNLALQLDTDMLAFAAALSVATGLLFGLFPAIHSTRPHLVTTLKANAGQPSGAKAAARFRVTLATGQIALSMTLLVSAGLFTKSLANIARVDLGLVTEQLVVFGVNPAMNGYSVAETRQLLERIEAQLSKFPGIANVTAARVRLISGDASASAFRLQGVAYDPEDDDSARYNYVGLDYLRTFGIALLAGREFLRSDIEGTPKVAIVNEAFLERNQLGHDAIGKRLQRMGRSSGFDIEIVGVAANSAYDEVKEKPMPLVLMPYRQDPDLAGLNIYARTRGAEQELLAAIPRLVREIDPGLPVARLRTMNAQINENVALDRFVASLSAVFAGLATLLAALGLYGVLAYTVSQRTREFGLRMALGAEAANVRGLVFRQVGLMTCVGATVGLLGAFALGRTAESLLFQMNARDPVVFAAAAVSLIAVALVAGLIPAQRAARVDPMTALRYE